MSNLNPKTNKRSQLDHLPPELRNKLKQFNNEGYIADDILPEIKISLLDAINNQELSSVYSLKCPNRIHYDIKELIVWIGVNFSVYITKPSESLFVEKLNKRICLVCFDEYERYDFIWEHDIENKIKDHKDIIDITIIKDYEEMLSLAINFKKTMQKKIGNLPKLGKKNDQGDLFLLDKKIRRPGYNKIKDEPRISLKDCICILLGIDDLSLIESIQNDLDYITEEQDKYSWEDDFLILPFAHADEPFRDVIATMKYRESWRDVVSFIGKFVFEIIEESNVGSIKWFDHSSLTGYTSFCIRDIYQETHKCYFKTLPFLKWAKEAGYARPDELSFTENADGTLQWSDSNKDNIRSDNKRSLDDLLLNSRKEVDILYVNLKSVLKIQGKDLFQAGCEDAIDAFSKSKQNYSILIQEDINNEINFTGNKPARDIKGGLLKNIVKRVQPELILNKTVKTDYQSLYQRSQGLIKLPKK